ncbi:MAG: manganese efflux pump MntP family protein [Marinilabiliaceae bacterium]|nr:manganese efflux pump MntP family protein [Marinilabiliaceae bacterium]
MSFITSLLLAVALAMDSFAVSITIGLQQKRFVPATLLKVPLAFGIFQGLFPLIGWWLSVQIGESLAAVDHYIAFALLAFIGGRMIYEAFHESGETKHTDLSKMRSVLYLATATSIDALAVGVSYGLVGIDLRTAIVIIAIVTILFSLAGIFIGVKMGNIFGSKAEIVGGAMLICLGIKIIVEHTLLD